MEKTKFDVSLLDKLLPRIDKKLKSRKVKPIEIENKINSTLIDFGLEKYRNTNAILPKY